MAGTNLGGTQNTIGVGAGQGKSPQEFFLPPPTNLLLGVPIYIAAIYDPTMEPGFNITTTQGYMSIAVAEANVGDNIEVPPTIGAAGDIILMGYKGFWNSRAAMFPDREHDWRPFFVNTGSTSGWDSDAERQNIDMTWKFSRDDEADNIQQLPALSAASDVILANYTGYRVSADLLLSADEGVENLAPIGVVGGPTLVGYKGYWVSRASMILADEGVERIQIASTTGWDTDADEINSCPPPFRSDDIYDDGITNLVTPTFDPQLFANVDEQYNIQGWTFTQDDESDFVEELPFLFNVSGNTGMGTYKSYWFKSALTLSDEGVERVQIALTTGWDTDADEQNAIPGWSFNQEDEQNVPEELPQLFVVSGQTTMGSYKGYWNSRSAMKLEDEGVENLAPIGLISGNTCIAGYRGYSTSKSNMILADEMVEFPITPVVVIYNDWTTDAENQKDNSWIAKDDLIDSGVERVQIASTTGWDTDAENQLDRSWSIKDDVSEAGENLVEIADTLGWDTEAENQKDNSWRIGDDQADSSVERVQINLTTAWDNDAENQKDVSWKFASDTLSDEDVENIIIPSAAPTHDDEKNQLWTGVISANLASDAGQETTNYIILPFNDFTTDAENQKLNPGYHTDRDVLEAGENLVEIADTLGWDNDVENQKDNSWKFGSDTLSDEGVERIQIASTTGWDTDAENQLDRSWRVTDTLAEDGENLVEIADTLGWDNDADQQRDNGWSIRDDVSDTGVERITINLTTGWDTDTENQKDNSWKFTSDTLSDEGVEYIILPFNDFTTDAENQKLNPGYDTDRDVSDPSENFVQIADTLGWDTDAEQQLDRTWKFNSDTLSDEEVEYITLPLNTWEIDRDNQKPQPDWYRDQQEDREATNYIILPFNDFTTDAENQKLNPDYIGIGSDQGEDWQHVIIIPPIVFSLTGWDTDAENQKNNSWQVGDDQLDSTVEILPFVSSASDIILMGYKGYWNSRSAMTLSDEQVELIIVSGFDPQYVIHDDDPGVTPSWKFGQDDILDSTVERIQIASTTGWDTDSENQKDNTWRFTSDDVLDSGVELVQPARVFDTDADQQFSNDFKVANVASDSGQDVTNYIILPFNDFTTDAENQKLNPENIGIGSDQGQDWTQYIIVPPFVTVLSAFDNDAENQKDNSWRVGDDVLDAETEYITLLLNDWSQDVQQPSTPNFDYVARNEDLVDSPPFIFIALSYDLDLENQRLQSGYDVDKDQSDNLVERIQIALTTGWDTDADQQLSNEQKVANLASDSGQEVTNYLIIPTVPLDTDAENQSQQADRSKDQLDETIVFVTVPLIEGMDDVQQKMQALGFTFDSQNERESTNYIILPFNDFTTDAENQSDHTVRVTDDVMDPNINFLPILYGWEDDAEQQNYQLIPLKDMIGEVEFTQYTIIPTVPLDTDADAQKLQPHYTVDTEVRDWPNLIVYSNGVIGGWDQAEVNQKQWLPWFQYDSQEERDWPNVITFPLPPLPICAHGMISLLYITVGTIIAYLTSSGSITPTASTTGEITQEIGTDGDISPDVTATGKGSFSSCEDE